MIESIFQKKKMIESVDIENYPNAKPLYISWRRRLRQTPKIWILKKALKSGC